MIRYMVPGEIFLLVRGGFSVRKVSRKFQKNRGGGMNILTTNVVKSRFSARKVVMRV